MESADFSFETCLSVLQQECSGQATLLRKSVLGQGAQASYFNFGSRSSLVGLCQRTLQQPIFVRYINQFLQHVFPAGCWSSFCVSHNEFAHVHQDQNLAGSLNYTISLGPFDGGCIWVQCSQDDFPDLPLVPPPDSTADQSLRGKLISTRRQGLAFDGRRFHCSAPWTGDRWVLTAYTSGNWSSLGEPEFRHLQSLDFPLPDIAPLCSTPAALSLSAECGVASQAKVLPGHAQSKEASFDPGLRGLPSAPLPPSPDAIEGNIFMELCCGPNRPLSKAFLDTGVSVISVDILRGSDQNLLDDAVFDRVMRVAGSGRVQLAHASPECIEYTRLKMQAPGPKPVRTPEHMQDLPGLSVEEQQRHRASRTLFVRCVAILKAVYAAGGHVVLEHPVNSLAWLEPEAVAFMRRIQRAFSLARRRIIS